MRTLTIVNVLIWGALVWVGLALLKRAEVRHLAVHAGAGQLAYFVQVPLAMMVITGLAYATTRVTGFKFSGMAIEVIATLGILALVLAYVSGAGTR